MTIHIAYTIDVQGSGAAQFVDQLIVGLYALKKTKRKQDKLVVHILYANLDAGTVLTCQKMASKDFELQFKSIRNQDLEYMQRFTSSSPTSNVRSWSGIVYARIWLSRALPTVNRIIYLDVDTLVRKSLHELYNVNLNNKMFGIVMGHTPEYGYNSGVMVIDCKRMRENEQMWYDLDKWMKKNAKSFYLPDQTTINRFFKDEITELPLCYNYPPKPRNCGVPADAKAHSDAVVWHFYFQGPKQHRYDEYERSNKVWNELLEEAEKKIR